MVFVMNEISSQISSSDINKLLDKSPFKASRHPVNLPLDNFLFSLLPYLSHREEERLEKKRKDEYFGSIDFYKEVFEIILSKVPEFQRKNDKWTVERQRQYVWNVLNGLRANPISLYNLKSDIPSTNCFIHDGLQRITSIGAFFTDSNFYLETDIGRIYRDDYLNAMPRRRIPTDINLEIHVYCFSNHKEACKHYIDINKGITHSDEDIQRAIDFMNKLG